MKQKNCKSTTSNINNWDLVHVWRR